MLLQTRHMQEKKVVDRKKRVRHHLWSVWINMRRRCTNKKDNRYSYYGARGIKVCARWAESFDAFVQDMGIRPDGFSLERIDNNKGYSPENCKWASREEQQNNKRSNVLVQSDGKVMTLAQLRAANNCTISHKVVAMRVARGWDLEKALTKPAGN